MLDAGFIRNSKPLHCKFWFLWTTRSSYMLRVLKALSDRSRHGSHGEFDDSLRYIGSVSDVSVIDSRCCLQANKDTSWRVIVYTGVLISP